MAHEHDYDLENVSVYDNLEDFFPLKVRTPPEWVDVALADFGAFLVDHAFCERKASSTALSLVIGNPEKYDLCEALIQLAREEMEHFHIVFRMLRERGLKLSDDHADPYVNALLSFARHDKEGRFMDRLLVFALIEARGCERFSLIGQNLKDPAMAKFYADLAKDEARHFGLFMKYANKYCGEEATQKRLDQYLDHEAKVIQTLPWRSSVH